MRKWRIVTFALLLAVMAGMAVSSADKTSAQGGLQWTVSSLNSTGCNAGNITFTTVLSGYTGGPERFRTIVDAGGLRYMDEDAGTPGGGDGTYGWALYNSSSGGPTSAVFPIPPGISITVTFMLIDGVGGPAVFQNQVLLSRCDGGTIVSGAGPDMVPIPDTAVVGSFLTTTPIYFAPRADAASIVVIEAGKTLYVFGVDASGGFYKVLLSGRFFWVPVNTMGPNFDNVWQGRPLPTIVVE